MTVADCWQTQFVLSSLETANAHRIVAEAREVEYLARLALDPDPYRDGTGALGMDWIVEDVACALRVPSATAASKLHVARVLVTRFPATFAAMRECRLDLRMATRLVEATEQLPDTAAAAVEAEVLDGVESRTLAQFGARVRRAVLRADPRTAEQQHEVQRELRRVVFSPVEHGMTELWALLPAERAVALAAEIHRRAKLAEGDDGRSADQRRADALCDMFGASPGTASANPSAASVNPGTASARPGGGPQVHVTVPISTLLGASEQPGEVAGYGPVTASVARRLAFDPTGTWRRLLTDTAGNLVDVSSRRYRPPVPMQRFVQLRDRTCRFPTCRRRAVSCELDHVTAWAEGGTTTPSNLIPLCARHHHLKHDGRWQVRRLPDGTVRWTSPTGRSYNRPPPGPLT